MSSSLRPTLYQAIISLLNQSEDLVVRIEAAMTLKTDILYHWFNENLNYIPVNAKKNNYVLIRSEPRKQDIHH